MEEILSKSTSGARRAGLASLATLSLVTAAAVAGAGAASAASDFKFDRVGGQNRYDTSQYVADAFASANKNVILANGSPTNYADALSANTLAGEMQSPILLTTRDKTPAPVLKQLDDDNVEKITVVGGPAVVSDEQVANLRSLGYTVERVNGDDRFGTNAKVIGMSGAAKGGVGLIATGFNFPDALSAGPFSYQGHPLGLTTRDSIEDEVVSALDDAGVTKVLIFGGTDVVKPAVEAKLATAGITVEKRFAGADRSETSTLAAKYAVDTLKFTNSHVGIASGYVKGYGADALSGGPLEGKEVAPMLVTKDVNNPGVVDDYLDANCGPLKTGHIFGLQEAISAAQEQTLTNAAQCKNAPANPSNKTVTDRPELVNAQVLETNASGPNAGTRIRYTFDENVTGKTPDKTKFLAYLYDGTQFVADDAIIDPSSNKAILARFTDAPLTRTTNDKTTADLEGSENLRVATVDFDAVRDDTASFTGADAANPIGDAQLAAGSETPGGNTGFTAGRTDAPDLISVSNLTQVPGQNNTVATFTFDEAATLVDGDNGGFHLVLQDGQTDLVGQVQNGDGTTSIEVVFSSTGTGGLTASNVARGYVDAGTVSDDAKDSDTADNTVAGTPEGDTNPLQAADVGNNGNSASPDLVSATLGNFAKDDAASNDYIDYKFDEAVTALLVNGANFRAYDASGEEISPAATPAAVRSTADNTVVRVYYTDGFLLQAVGASVREGAVQADDGAPLANQEDEVGVANSNSNASAGSSTVRTAGPDLTGVTITANKDIFGTPTGTYTATYAFDEKLASINTPGNDGFQLVLGNGDIVDVDNCVIDTVTTTSGTENTNTVTCDTFPGASTGQPNQAVLGTVDDGNVDDADGNLNPEGAEVVTGATAGSPQA
ncbi:MAG: cell wall-binding repeat-containing protein [Nocardioides sp.]